MVELAKEDLAQRLGVSVEEIEVLSVEPVEWRDTSLGCAQPGMMYGQVITPGFKVVLATEGATYEYHTDRGTALTICGEHAPLIPSAGRSDPGPTSIIATPLTDPLAGTRGITMEVKDYSLLCDMKRSGRTARSLLCR